MYDLIRTYQMDIMLVLCSASGTIAVLLLFTRFLTTRRKLVLFNMEVLSALLLGFDRQAYIYSGDISHTGWVMVRLSNFMVFFLTSAIVLAFNLFLMDLFTGEGKVRESVPVRLKAVMGIAVVGMIMSVVSAFTGLYYYFDDQNIYHRGAGFLIAYIIPVICPLIQYTVVRQYRKSQSRFINIALTLYIFFPLAAGIIQIFAYGLSIVNMAMVIVSVSLYIFTYLDINDTAVRAHELELQNLEEEQKGMKRLFDQTATAFVESVEKREAFLEGHSLKAASIAKRIAGEAGKSEEECDRVYYAALLNNVGTASLTDSKIEEAGISGEQGEAARREKAQITNEILSGITEYPYLSEVAGASHERFDGSGYPNGLAGEDIPEMARIVAVAEAYAEMKSETADREALPDQMIREAFVKESGLAYDPDYSDIMIRIIDENKSFDKENERTVGKELTCGSYRDSISTGVRVSGKEVTIRFSFEPTRKESGLFCDPSLILFDSFDHRVHDNGKAIEAYHYLEYGEFWFDGRSIATNISDMSTAVEPAPAGAEERGYVIRAGRYEDHLKLVLESPEGTVETIIALPDSTSASYIALTGENCRLSDITVEYGEEELTEDAIPRISDKKSFIDRIESDIPNVQIDRTLSAFTRGIEITDGLRLRFFSMSLPSSSLVWHCPYVLLFSSDDGEVHGSNYHEYVLVKLNGEKEDKQEYASNSFRMKKTEEFPGWDRWKDSCREGMEFEVRFRKKGNRITIGAVNMGITVEDTLVINDGAEHVYAALTGDQVALTDIRIL